jgi:hypothetical protein
MLPRRAVEIEKGATEEHGQKSEGSMTTMVYGG